VDELIACFENDLHWNEPMDGNVLNIASLQPDIRWKDTVSNRQKYSSMFSRLTTPVTWLLPNVHHGLLHQLADVAEDMDGETVQWMKSSRQTFTQ
jgi:hypothetical protein